MNESEVPAGIPSGVGLALCCLPLLVAALKYAARVLPRVESSGYRWPLRAALAVVAAPFLALFTLQALLPVPAAAATPGSTPATLSALFGSQLVLGSAGGLAVLLAARRAGGLASLGLAARVPPRARVAVLLVYVPGFLCLGGVGIVWAHVCRAFGWEAQQEVMRLILGLEPRELVLAGVVAVLLGPLIEELVFRGFLQGFLESRMGRYGARVLTSALFAGLHGMAGLPILFALSLLLGWLQQRTRCLWVPWFAHALNNAVTLGIALSVGAR